MILYNKSFVIKGMRYTYIHYMLKIIILYNKELDYKE